MQIYIYIFFFMILWLHFVILHLWIECIWTEIELRIEQQNQRIKYIIHSSLITRITEQTNEQQLQIIAINLIIKLYCLLLQQATLQPCNPVTLATIDPFIQHPEVGFCYICKIWILSRCTNNGYVSVHKIYNLIKEWVYAGNELDWVELSGVELMAVT